MWYVEYQHRQHPLGVTDPNDRAGADAAFARLIAGEVVKAQQKEPPGRTVAAAVRDYLAEREADVNAGQIQAKSVRNYRIALKWFDQDFGTRLLAQVSGQEVAAWAARRGWSSSYQHDVLGVVQQLFKWAGVAVTIRRPPKESLGAEVVLTDAQFGLVLANVYLKKGGKGDLVALLKVLRETGARPAEVSGLTVEGVDWPNACARLRKHKTQRHTGRERVIHFNAAAMAVLEGQRAKYQTGLLFRTRGGKKRYGPNVIVKQLLLVSERVGFRVTAYGLGRHSFATTALVNGVPDTLVAGLLGHVGTGMLHRHYSHLGEQARALKDAAERARAG